MYKCEMEGIDCIETEESYTSKASALDLDHLPTLDSKVLKVKHKFSGRRVKRGLYKTKGRYVD